MDDEDKKRIHSLLVKAQGGPDKLEIFDVELTDKDVVSSFSSRVQDETGKFVNRVFISHKLSDEMRLVALEKELHHLLAVAEDKFEPGDVSRLFGWVDGVIPQPEKPTLSVSAVVIPEKKVTGGILIKSASIAWAAIIDELEKDWTKAYEIDPRVWEEIIAGAYSKAGFDEVILTPRSGDFGRDVIAIRNGIGCIKIIGSVKAYSPGHLVNHDDVRSLLGVMSGELNTSKGILTTTSDFAPRIPTDPFIQPFLPTRLELMNGAQLKQWLIDLANKAEK
jgi:restriction system protein